MKNKELFLNYPTSSNQTFSNNKFQKVAPCRLHGKDLEPVIVSIETDIYFQLEQPVKGSLEPLK